MLISVKTMAINTVRTIFRIALEKAPMALCWII